ncbi:MAG: DUF4476 domain-containing protein [Bacteroidia bacterium]|nr:DUF4476 domain-containing protein [Bacteroidia bacterium]
MKTIFTLLASLILSITVFATDAKPNKSMLTINSADRGDIRVVIDGRRFEPNDNYMRIGSIDAGYHTLKIYRERNTGLFRIFGKMYEVVYSSSLRIKPRTSVLISVDRFGRATVNEARTNGRFNQDTRGFGGHDDRNFGNRDDRNDMNWDNKHDFDFGRGNNQGDYDNDRDARGDRNGQFDGRDVRIDNNGRDDRGYNGNSYSKAMGDFEFNRTLSSIQNEWNESNKVRSANQVINTSYFTASQVKQMLQLFNNENSKLDLAKLAYVKTVDQENYFMINSVFSFNNSKDELARYIRSH